MKLTPVSEELFEVFRRMYDVLSRGEWETFLPTLHDDVEVHQSPEIPGTTGSFHGKRGAVRAMEEIAEAFGDIDWSPRHIYDLGDGRILSLVKPKVRGKGSGIQLESEVGHVVHMRAGKIARLDVYLGWEKALQAVGLSEQDAHAHS
jgi:ketosteroid isomerase-like protein